MRGLELGGLISISTISDLIWNYTKYSNKHFLGLILKIDHISTAWVPGIGFEIILNIRTVSYCIFWKLLIFNPLNVAPKAKRGLNLEGLGG